MAEDKLQTGSEVLAEFAEDGAIYCARILKVETENRKCQVEFYDFGNTATCPFSKVYYYDEQKFQYIQPLAYCIKIPGFDWTEYGESVFKFIEENLTEFHRNVTGDEDGIVVGDVTMFNGESFIDNLRKNFQPQNISNGHVEGNFSENFEKKKIC